jgi:hypothetical protein
MSDLDDLARAAGNLPARRPTRVTPTRYEPAVERVYIAFDAGSQKGPFSEDELRAMRAAGRLSHQTLVTADGWGEWFPIESVLVPASPPPLRATPAVAVQGDYANVDIANTTTNVTTYVNQSYHYHTPPRAKKKSGLRALGATIMLVGLVTTCVFAPLGVILLSVGLVLTLIGLIQD